jgi:hypothetical protein
VHALCNAPGLGSLVSLNLGRLMEFTCSGKGNAFARSIADSAYLTRLEELYLMDDTIDDVGAAALACSATLGQLRVLDLSGNAIGPIGASEIAASRTLLHLSRLRLDGNRLGEDIDDVKETLRTRFGAAFTWEEYLAQED